MTCSGKIEVMSLNESGATEKSSALYQDERKAMATNDLKSAISLFEQSIQSDPHFKTLELLGECFLKLGRNKEAVVPLAASVGLGNKPYRALYLLAQALNAAGRKTDAIEKLNQAIEMKPDYKSARALLSNIRIS